MYRIVTAQCLGVYVLTKSFLLLCPDKAAADANAAAWAAYYAQYGQQPQAPMTPTSGAPGTTQTNGQGNRTVLTLSRTSALPGEAETTADER